MASAKLKLATKIILALIIGFGFLYINLFSIDPDLGWHLRVGEWIYQKWQVPKEDIYTYTMPGYNWVNHEWLMDGWFWWIYTNGYWPIVAIIFALFAAVPLWIWLGRANNFLQIWIVALIAVILTYSIGLRPQVLSFFMFFVLWEILYLRYKENSEFYQKKFSKRARYFIFAALPLFFLIWANLHAGFAGGLILFGIMIFAVYADLFIEKKVVPIKMLVFDVILFMASALAPLLNPYGLDLYREIINASTNPMTGKYILEWRPILTFGYYSFAVLLALIILFIWTFFNQYNLKILIPATVFLIFTFKHARHIQLFLLTAIPMLFIGTQELQNEISKADANLTGRYKKMFQKLLLGIWILIIFTVGDFLYIISSSSKRLSYPSDNALIALAQKRPIGSVFNPYAWGGYLLWKIPELSPDPFCREIYSLKTESSNYDPEYAFSRCGLKVFIDGRMPHWRESSGNSAMAEHVAIGESTDGKEVYKIFKKREIRVALFEPDKKSKPNRFLNIGDPLLKIKLIRKIIQYLEELKGQERINLKEFLLQHGWKEDYKDNTAVILSCDDLCWENWTRINPSAIY